MTPFDLLDALLQELFALKILVDLGMGHNTANGGTFSVAGVLEVDHAQGGFAILVLGELVLIPLLALGVPVDGVCMDVVASANQILLHTDRQYIGVTYTPILVLACSVTPLDVPFDAVPISVLVGVTALPGRESTSSGLTLGPGLADGKCFYTGVVLLRLAGICAITLE